MKDGKGVEVVKPSVSHTKKKWCVLSYTVSPHELMLQEPIALDSESYRKPTRNKQTKTLLCKAVYSLTIQLGKSWNVLTVVMVGGGGVGTSFLQEF